MNETNCENILMAKMAELEGEKTEISAENVNLHFSICENCRNEFAQMQNIGDLFKAQTRHEANPNLWSAIDEQITEKKSLSAKPFVFLGIFLLVYRLLELLSEGGFSLAIKMIPVIFIIALFVFIKENPFKINTELILER